jgi:hypothetical protein
VAACLTLAATAGFAQTANSNFQSAYVGSWSFDRLTESAGEARSSTYLFSPAEKSFRLGRILDFKLPWNAVQHTFLFGPEFHVHFLNRFTANFWLLGGSAKRFALFDPLVQATDAAPPVQGFRAFPRYQTTFNGANARTVSAGASLDLKLTDRLLFRVLQADYLRMRWKELAPRDTRYSTGIRLSFGK